MSNTITIELCAEDRARLDRLAAALERRSCDKCVADAIKLAQLPQDSTPAEPVQNTATNVEAEAAQESPTEAAEAPKADTLTTAPPAAEEPTAAEPAPSAPAKTVTRAELRSLAITVSQAGKRDEMAETIRLYAAKVSDVPEDKIAECYEKLQKLMEVPAK